MRDDLDQRIRATADRAHDFQVKGVQALLPTVVSLGSDAMKAAALISGGSAAATLAFIGQLAAKDKTTLALSLMWPLSAFVVSLFVACVGTASAYLAQYAYSLHADSRAMNFEYPFTHPTRMTKVLLWSAIAFHILTVALFAAAYVVLFVGYLAVNAAVSRYGFT